MSSSFEHLRELSINYYSIQRDAPLTQQLLPYLITGLLLFVAFHCGSEESVKDAFPIANPRKWFEFTNWRRVLEFDMSPREHFARFTLSYPKTPYWLNSELGKVLILPSNMINEIRVTPKMSSIAAIQEVRYINPRVQLEHTTAQICRPMSALTGSNKFMCA